RGAHAQVQRRAASFEFNTKSLRAFVFDRVRHEAADRLVPLLRQASRNGQVLDLQNEEGERFFRAFHAAAHLSVDRLKLPHPLVWKLKRWLDTEDERRLRESTAVVHEFVDKPDVVDHIREELRLVRARRCEPGGEAFTLEELREMNYLHAAIAESLRLHPAVPLLPRVCAADDEMPDGTRVRRGWTVMYNSYAMGRAEAIWGKDCGEYRPERWLEVGVFQARSAFQYPVFHAGPRMCLGKEMAVIQMKAITASILEGLDMELAEPRGKHDLSISMRMEGGLPMRFRERRAP
ncbi:hypothetical protein MUK42_06673, partial [Musa troglodytarum]